jgi:SAM-dependent methyltransferase
MASGGGRSEVERGQAVYDKRFLRVYDTFVLGLSTPLVWGCKLARLRELYDRNVSGRHLDVGVGTGYFLDKARWPSTPGTPGTPVVTLADLNANSLAAAADRIERFSPATVTADALQPLPDDLASTPFDSVGLNYLLHCLPGDMADKAATVFGNVMPHVTPGGVVFGSTILAEGVRVPPQAKPLLKAYNRKGIFHNEGDSLAALDAALAGAFATHTVEVAGMVAIFTARTAPATPA